MPISRPKDKSVKLKNPSWLLPEDKLRKKFRSKSKMTKRKRLKRWTSNMRRCSEPRNRRQLRKTRKSKRRFKERTSKLFNWWTSSHIWNTKWHTNFYKTTTGTTRRSPTTSESKGSNKKKPIKKKSKRSSKSFPSARISSTLTRSRLSWLLPTGTFPKSSATTKLNKAAKTWLRWY